MSVTCSVQQAGPRQASPRHDVVQPADPRSSMSSDALNQSRHHTALNVVMWKSHDVPEVPKFMAFDVIKQFAFCTSHSVDLLCGHWHSPRNSQ